MKNNTKLFVIGILIIGAIFGIFVVIGNSKTKEVSKEGNTNNILQAKTETYQSISTTDAKELIKRNSGNKDFLIIDIRTPDEFAQGHIENATNIDFYQSDFESKIASLDKNGAYLIYCKSGGRSSKALEVFKQESFREVYNLLGGYTEYIK